MTNVMHTGFILQFIYYIPLHFIVEPCIDKNIINSNQLMHIFIKKHIKIM
jgi:hypothetical protein